MDSISFDIIFKAYRILYKNPEKLTLHFHLLRLSKLYGELIFFNTQFHLVYRRGFYIWMNIYLKLWIYKISFYIEVIRTVV